MRSALLTLALLCGSAHADFKDGNKLLAELNDPGAVFSSVGIGYITGVTDAYGGVTHCAPQGVTAGQIRDMVKNYLENNPAIRHLPASMIVSHVLKSTWPCAKKGTGT